MFSPTETRLQPVSGCSNDCLCVVFLLYSSFSDVIMLARWMLCVCYAGYYCFEYVVCCISVCYIVQVRLWHVRHHDLSHGVT